jgi:hypothetical protein
LGRVGSLLQLTGSEAFILGPPKLLRDRTFGDISNQANPQNQQHGSSKKSPPGMLMFLGKKERGAR